MSGFTEKITYSDVLTTMKVLTIAAGEQDDLQQRRNTALTIMETCFSNKHLFDFKGKTGNLKLFEAIYLKAKGASQGDRRFEEYVHKFANVLHANDEPIDQIVADDEPTANKVTPMTTCSQTDIALQIDKIEKRNLSMGFGLGLKSKLNRLDEKKTKRLKRELNLLL